MLHTLLLVLVTCSARALVSRADEGAGLRQQRLLADGEPQSATLLLGSAYNLSCKWDGEPSGKLWWMRNGALFAQHNRSFAVPRHRVYIERGAPPLSCLVFVNPSARPPARRSYTLD